MKLYIVRSSYCTLEVGLVLQSGRHGIGEGDEPSTLPCNIKLPDGPFHLPHPSFSLLHSDQTYELAVYIVDARGEEAKTARTQKKRETKKKKKIRKFQNLRVDVIWCWCFFPSPPKLKFQNAQAEFNPLHNSLPHSKVEPRPRQDNTYLHYTLRFRTQVSTITIPPRLDSSEDTSSPAAFASAETLHWSCSHDDGCGRHKAPLVSSHLLVGSSI